MIIITKYHGPTNSKGSRISAHAPGWNLPRIYISYPYDKTGADCHAEAARALLEKGGLIRENEIFMVAGIPSGYCFISRDNGRAINLGKKG